MKRTVTITGGSGYVGQLLRRRLSPRHHEIRVFDQYRGVLVDALRRRYFGSRTAQPWGRRLAFAIHSAQGPAERALRRAHLIRRREDDICAARSDLVKRFAGSDAVIHLAGIPHPFWPGAEPEDFWRLNYEASVNVFEAAREAGVGVFIFASSAQVYKINDPVRISRFPILESEYLPLPAEGQTMYGHLKAAFERYLAGACEQGGIQGIALRLEYPGFQSRGPQNLYVSTSLQNLATMFTRALDPPSSLRFEAFNVADATVDPSIVDVQSYLATAWPQVPNYTNANQSLVSTEKAEQLLGYVPCQNASYVDERLVW